MQLLTDLDLDSFFERVERADARVLFLDVDGTLAPFRVDRRGAPFYPAVAELLSSVLEIRTARVVLVSGRPAMELAAIAEQLGLRIEVWGSHGLERLTADGRYERATLPAEVRAHLVEEEVALDAKGWGHRLERKPLGLALHGRGLPEPAVAAMRREVEDRWMRLEPWGLVIHEFDGGFELRPRTGDKGAAVRTVLAELGVPTVGAFLGDDRTDEDAFRAIRGHGIGVLVRETLRETAADLWLRPPLELLDFLGRWRTSVAKGRGPV